MLLAGCKLLWLSLGWSLCTCKLERHTSPHAAFPWFDQVGSAGLLSMLTSLGVVMDSYTFPWFLFLRPTRVKLLAESHFSTGVLWCAQLPYGLQHSPLALSPAAQHARSGRAALRAHQWWRATAQRLGERGILGTVGSSLTKRDRWESQSSAKINPASV